MTGCQGSHETRPASERLPRQVAQDAGLAAWGPARWLGLSLRLGRWTPPYASPGWLTAKPLAAGRAGCPVPVQTRPGALHAFQKQVPVRAPGSPPLCWLAPPAGRPVRCLRPWKCVHGSRMPQEHSLRGAEARLIPHPWLSCPHPASFGRGWSPGWGGSLLWVQGTDEAQAGKFSRPTRFQSQRPFCPIRCSWASASRVGTPFLLPYPLRISISTGWGPPGGLVVG